MSLAAAALRALRSRRANYRSRRARKRRVHWLRRRVIIMRARGTPSRIVGRTGRQTDRPTGADGKPDVASIVVPRHAHRAHHFCGGFGPDRSWQRIETGAGAYQPGALAERCGRYRAPATAGGTRLNRCASSGVSIRTPFSAATNSLFMSPDARGEAVTVHFTIRLDRTDSLGTTGRPLLRLGGAASQLATCSSWRCG